MEGAIFVALVWIVIDLELIEWRATQILRLLERTMSKHDRA